MKTTIILTLALSSLAHAQELRLSANPDLIGSTSNDYGLWGAPELINSFTNDYGPVGSPEFVTGISNDYGIGLGLKLIQPSFELIQVPLEVP
jgi:hypothetical protein